MPGETPVDTSAARWGGDDDVKGPETQDGKWEDEVKGKEDKALLNLITQTAKKSSYNNSKRHGLNASDGDEINKRHGLGAVSGDEINKRHGLTAGGGNEINKKRVSSVLFWARLVAKLVWAQVDTLDYKPLAARRAQNVLATRAIFDCATYSFILCSQGSFARRETLSRVVRAKHTMSFFTHIFLSAFLHNPQVDTKANNGKRKKSSGAFMCCGSSAGASDDSAKRDPTSKVSYNIEHLIGEGGFSKVLLVRAKSGHIDLQLNGASQKPSALTGEQDITENGKVYAAKIIPKSHLKSAGDSFIKATMLERNILGKFHHPFLLKLYHAFQERDRLILVIDYCPGGSLHTHVNISLREKGTGFDEERAAFYVSEIALAIAHLHKHGIVHRDLKLENVLMYRSGHCAVSDFGASKRIKPMDPESCSAGKTRGHAPTAPTDSSCDAGDMGGDIAPVVTHTKSIVGTPAYMAPEMLLTQPYDFSVDWWALGVVLFTMLKGRLPFDAPEEEKMLWRIVKSKPRYDPNWSQPLLDVLRALLQKRPTTRLSSLRALSKHELYRDTQWRALENLEIKPPYIPSFNTDNDTKYLPKRIAETALPTMSLDYKKGDSMKKLFKKFSHRGSFDSNTVRAIDRS